MNFFYEAKDTAGESVVGKIEASSEQEVRTRLLTSGYQPLSVVASAPAATSAVSATNPVSSVMAPPTSRTTVTGVQGATRMRTGGVTLTGNAARIAEQNRKRGVVLRTQPASVVAPSEVSKRGGVSTRQLLLLFQQLSTMIRSGINVYSAMADLAGRTQNRNLAHTLAEMAESARHGGRISDVMARYPRIYPPHVVGIIRAGEQGGFLEVALQEIALNYEQNIALYRGAWIPKTMALQAYLMIPFVANFRMLFDGLLGGATGGSPIAAYLAVTLFRNVPIALAVLAAVLWANSHVQLPQYRHLRDSLALRIPPIGELQRMAGLATFIRMLRRLVHAGVAPINAWDCAMNTATNTVIRDRLAEAYAQMQGGAPLSTAFQSTGLFANSVEQLLITGQQSGEIVESLDNVATYYQDRVDQAARKSTFMMLRFGILAMLVFGGAAFCWVAYAYSGVLMSIMKNME